ncbi:putative glycosidase crf1 [Cytospora mali]|uniref:Glycosidase crf1 n=1 Tax=Cytospora mali TaxID=578113 RepID=A0A194VH14_CYTMA|nr:putative glycosidase crf1 [Valsa mali]
MHIRKLVAATTAVGISAANAQCNPTKGTCSPIPGLTSTLNTDFTKLTSSLTKDWVVASDEPFSTSSTNGAVLSMKKRGDAPYIWTSGYFQYGHVDVVLQTAPGVGVITAGVLYSDTLDEIDLEFSGNDYGAKTPTFETNYFGKGITGTYDRSTSVSPGFNTTAGFHTYSLDWTADKLTWSVDGTVVRTLLKANCDNNEHQYPQTPAQFHVGVWDGGDPSNAPGVIQWAGGQTNLNGFPYTAYVKSVEIVPASNCAYYNYTDTSGSSGSVKCLSALPSSTTKASTSTKSNSISTSVQAHSSATKATTTVKTSPSSKAGSSTKSTSSTANVVNSLGVNVAANYPASGSIGLTTSTVYKTSVYSTVTSCDPSITNCPANQPHLSTVVVTDVVIDYTTICPVTETQTTRTSSNKPASSSSESTPSTNPGGASSSKAFSSVSTAKSSALSPQIKVSSIESTSSDAVPFYITPVQPASSSSSSKSSSDFTSGSTTITVTSGVATISVQPSLTVTSAMASNSASMSVDFGTASPSLYNIDTEMSSSIVASPSSSISPSGQQQTSPTPSLSSPLPPVAQTVSSSTDSNSANVVNPSSRVPAGNSTSANTPAIQSPATGSQSNGSSYSAVDVQPVLSTAPGTTTVRNKVTSTTTVSLTPTGLSTGTIYSTPETTVASCTPDSISGTDCLATTSSTAEPPIAITPVTDTTASVVVAQPPIASQVQDGGGSPDVDGQTDTTGVTGDIPSSASRGGAPPSGVAGAGYGTGAGTSTLKTPVGPSSTIGTAQIAGSGRTIGSGGLLAMVAAGVTCFILF